MFINFIYTLADCAEIEDKGMIPNPGLEKTQLIKIWDSLLKLPHEMVNFWIDQKNNTKKGQDLLLKMRESIDVSKKSVPLDHLVVTCFYILEDRNHKDTIKNSVGILNGKLAYLKLPDQTGVIRHLDFKYTYNGISYSTELIDTDVLFILGEDGNTYLGYDVRCSLQPIKAMLLEMYSILFLSDLDKRDVVFIDAGQSVTLSNKVTYPLAEILIPLDARSLDDSAHF